MKSWVLFFVTTIFLCCWACWAVAQQLSFMRVSPAEGNVWGLVTCMTQDKQGYMWFSTQNGIYRYDGYEWVNYKNDPMNPQSLANNWTETILTDHNGIIWIGTFGSGLDRLDPATGIFTHYRRNPQNKNSLSSDTVTVLAEDHQGTLWVGTHGGVNQFHPNSGNFTRYKQIKNDTTSLSNNQVRAMHVDRQGILWVGCGSPFPGETPEGEGGLNRLNRHTGKFQRYLHNPKDPQSLIDNKIRSIFEDSQGNFWIGTYFDGLHSMDRAKGTFVRHTYDLKHPEKLSRPYLRQGITPDGVTFIHEDAAGSVWIGSYIGGLNRYDLKSKQLTHFEASKEKDNLENNGGWWAFTSREGVLWISTGEGNLYRIDPFRSRIPHIELGTQVNAIHEDSAGDLWLGTKQGLVRKNRTKGTIQRFVHDPKNPNSLSNNEVEVICEDRNGALWIGTRNSAGLNRFDRRTQTFKHYQANYNISNSITNGTIFAIYEDRQGTIWVGTTEGLNRMDARTGTFTHYQNNGQDSTSISNNYITRICEDRHGYLWVGNWNGGGLNRLNRQTGEFKHYLPGSNITSIYEDTDGILWAGGINGLFQLKSSSNQFVPFIDPNSTQVIPSVANITEDDKKQLWVSTSGGLIRLNRERSAVSLYGKSHGVNGNTINYAGFKGRKGELFFGDQTGYYAFFPDQVKGNFKLPQVILTDFLLFNMPVKANNESPLNEPVSSAQKINLGYKENIFGFNFVGIHYSNPEENRHLFKLDNYDNSWRIATTDHTAFYYKVPPGSYIFRVRVANSDGAWAEKSIPVIIRSPWWTTWWAYLLYTVVFVGSIWGFIEVRSRNLKEKNRFLEEKVAQRTAEVTARNQEIIAQNQKIQAQRDHVEKTLQELQATQNQLIQKEKMASLGELTAGIAHEIQNPLNFVNNFAEVSEELCNELQNQLVVKDPDAAGMVETLKQNLRKIYQHGQRADNIVRGMLQHSRQSTGQKEPTDINALTDEYLRLSYHGMRAKDSNFNVILKTDFGSQVDKVKVVPQELGRVLLNLFNNAFYATQQKKNQLNGQYQPEVQVSTSLQNGMIEIKVRDNGTGIPEGVRQKIFQPFFTTKPTGQGTGLGLSLSYDIVTKGHGGEIKVDTEPNQGTTFTIYIPN